MRTVAGDGTPGTADGTGGAARFKLGPEAVLVKLERALLAKRPAARYAVTTPTHLMGALRRILPQPMLDWALNKASDQ